MIEMEALSATPISRQKPFGTGGFLHPEIIAERFGIKEGMVISDFGSGAGYFTIILAEKTGPEGIVYALDVQEMALDNVRARAGAEGINNIQTIRTNLEILGGSSLADSSQDIVLLANILFQSRKYADIIKEGVRVLKGGGNMIIIDWKKSTGGFGPPDDIRLSEENITKAAGESGLKSEGPIDAGEFHFGLIFKKP